MQLNCTDNGQIGIHSSEPRFDLINIMTAHILYAHLGQNHHCIHTESSFLICTHAYVYIHVHIICIYIQVYVYMYAFLSYMPFYLPPVFESTLARFRIAQLISSLSPCFIVNSTATAILPLFHSSFSLSLLVPHTCRQTQTNPHPYKHRGNQRHEQNIYVPMNYLILMGSLYICVYK